MPFTRRQFLNSTAASTAAVSFAGFSLADAGTTQPALIDTHVYLGHWPHKRLSVSTPDELVAALRRNNTSQTWVGSFDGLFHKDVAAVNRRLAEACSQVGVEMLIPFGTINPTLPDWEDDIRRCHETFHMPGIRVHPNFHGYTLDDPRFAQLLELASARQLIVQLVTWMEDERHVYLNPHTAQVDLKPLADRVASLRDLKLVIANADAAATDERTARLLALKQVYWDVGRATDPTVVRRLLEKASSERVLFGSGTPLHDAETAMARIENAQLTAADKLSIQGANANRLFGTKRNAAKDSGS